MPKKTSFRSAINEALGAALEKDKDVICFGLGADDPTGIFGTTLGLQEKYGEDRVFDTPTSENGMTGVAIGAALGGKFPVMSHQRLDFFLLSMDQLINNAAKWRYMFGGQNSVPITIRLILGRGWGQGPTHSQNLQSWFAHVPGLKVVCPTTPQKAKDMLYSSIFDPNPVLFFEHRWLHNMEGEVAENPNIVPLDRADVVHDGSDITVVCYSYLVPEAIRAAKYLKDKHNLGAEVIDMSSIQPIDWETIQSSVRKTGHLLALDTSHEHCSVSSEVITKSVEMNWGGLKKQPKRLALPNHPTPTSHALTANFYNDASSIAQTIAQMFEINDDTLKKDLVKPGPHDVPGDWFKGPF